ncbi:hypothetical protein ACVWYH_009515 [Bradyrhizobium sp. GM24.11]
MALGDDLGFDDAVLDVVAAEMREGGIAAQHLAVVQAHDAAAEGAIDAVFNLVESVEQSHEPAKSKRIAGDIAPSLHQGHPAYPRRAARGPCSAMMPACPCFARRVKRIS